MEQRETATDGLVKMTPEYADQATGQYEACTDTSLIASILKAIKGTDNLRSEIRMIDDSGWLPLLSSISFVEMLSDPF